MFCIWSIYLNLDVEIQKKKSIKIALTVGKVFYTFLGVYSSKIHMKKILIQTGIQFTFFLFFVHLQFAYLLIVFVI